MAVLTMTNNTAEPHYTYGNLHINRPHAWGLIQRRILPCPYCKTRRRTVIYGEPLPTWYPWWMSCCSCGATWTTDDPRARYGPTKKRAAEAKWYWKQQPVTGKETQ